MSNDSHRPSIDGFTLRRRTADMDGFKGLASRPDIASHSQALRPHVDRPRVESSAAPEILPRAEAAIAGGLRRADIDESLRAVDEAPTPKKKDKTKKRRKWFLRKKVLIPVAILLLLLGGGGYFLTKIMAASARVFSSGSVFDLLSSGTKLKADANGWTHVLVFGTSEDDKGHDGKYLTDSILVVSVNQEKKVAAMTSMPRDMWVTYDGGCQFGYQGKINAVYECAGSVDGSLENIDVAKGVAALQKKVGEVFGLNIQYYTKVNYSVVRDVTTALGGVTVNIEGAFGAKGIYDSGMGNLLKLPNGPATLQGEQALAFVRARGEGYGSYGLNGNFSREQNQQKMILAIRDKALSLGTLTNPVALSGLIDSLGGNIRTNFSTGEVKTLAMLAKDISADKVTHIDLANEKKPLVNTGMYNSQSIVKPVAGLTDFTKIQAYIQGQLEGGSLESEDATVSILNGSTKVGAAALQQTTLTQAGFMNTVVGNTTYRPTSAVVWYDLSAGKMPKTKEKLASVLGVASSGATLPSGVSSTADFVVIIGNSSTTTP